ncbi:polyribonucleotide nucleotidyltransferase [Candidatus Beckwithbacteria bacterium CG10_big_fil_rev_8_21_14_0_10_34_10]|uniref:Polyribonucleotide nucleotidyltransferase n=1 Tax=Candidatus Beckwithbacteria bacterium CG10_big_fil_rev_8_21_14_0_10_34_10 TaxID=1974495 RepID=A0A2H0W9I9_9BACT|nr:MAG: polyribonucleotide nucleotidyltransferase [Candidatus Beckwithbacteria bacterium CG10_big_fil_rev_8_21_14_0_10_34_10]
MKKTSFQFSGKEVNLQTEKFAPQANASVLAQMGDTIVLATVVSSPPREELDYFPLYVEYQEKLYAGGKIKGSRWVKREGRPSDEAILTSRLIDRSIRPLFPKDYKNEVQVIITVLSFDDENDPDTLAILAVSSALSISDIPWNGPVAAVRLTDPEFPNLNLVISGTKNEIIMIEAGASEVKEEEVLKAINKGFAEIKKTVLEIEKLVEKDGQKKQTFEVKKINPELQTKVIKKAKANILDLIKNGDKNKGKLVLLEEIKKALEEELQDEPKKEIRKIVDDLFKNLLRDQVLEKKVRYDKRKPDQIRQLNIEVGLFKRTHGTALFQRGLTQAITITTLGSPSLEQWIEGMEGEERKRYIHHYCMPPFSVGETGRVGWPSRREIGHGSLAERALEPVIPEENVFPYTIRVVSEILSSNGSTSMASVCGSSLSLMDAGVPIKKAVAGIAMGLILNQDKKNDYVILTDILGLEDHIGDMDFKVAGTIDGINALQMDVKSLKITPELLKEGLEQAKKARLFILGEMNKVLPAPRSSISPYAPKIAILQVDKEKIGEVIGPGGKIIRKIIAETETTVDIDDEGKITIASQNQENIKKAVEWIEGLTREVQIGEEFEGEVKRIEPFGAFVEILPGKDGLVHVSRMSAGFVKHPDEIVKLGEKVKVKVVDVDDMKRVSLSMFFGEKEKPNNGINSQAQPGNKRNFKDSRNNRRSSNKSLSYKKRF